MIIAFSNVLNVEYPTVKYSTRDNVTDSDIGNVTYTGMGIKLHGNTPVILNYHSVPKPLDAELCIPDRYPLPKIQPCRELIF